MKRIMNLQMFAAPTGTIVSTDVEPAISIDFTNRLATNIVELQNVLGVTNMIPMRLLRSSGNRQARSS